MDVEGLEASPIGKLVPIRAPDPATREMVDGKAFLPDPLPPEVTLSTGTWTIISNATAALARLDGAARRMPSPDLLRRPALRREAQSTSALEGTYAPFADVLAADPAEPGQMSAELQEILNFERMAELAFSWPEDRPLNLSMVGELQRTLVRGTAAEARFVPPPPGDQLRSGLETLLDWIEEPPNLPTVVQAAMAHYQFETLHPYSDGNGRLGRLLVIVQLLRGALIHEPLLVVSPWFERRRETYQEALLRLSVSGDWDPWIAFFAEGVAASAAESQEKVERLIALQGDLRARVRQAGKRGVAERLAADLVGEPFVTRRGVERRYELSKQGAYNTIKTLLDLDLLEPTNIGISRGGQSYVAPAVLEVASP